ncbi:MAG: TetR/AcrR family transcriptional regulator [Armatimonadota bacterium]|nr:TetR/AcrR family transcriptional regulator [Armatimonadota bacterium]MDR7569122.1 TetR/AcrR family transcriptional regulator [Armatimonadota bacterium]MDR7613432.1 TetR/AcrR family transcriptional regulator [Armatimonadota bacterium]
MAQSLVRPRHEELVAAAVRLFRERGYHATSMQDLAEALGIQRGSLYHYIAAKEDLLWEIMDRAMTRLWAAVAPVARASSSAVRRLQEAIAAHLAVAASLRDELTILHVELKSLSPGRRREMVARRDRYEALFREILEEGIARGEFREVDVRATAFALLGACNWFTQWFRPDGPQGHDHFARWFSELFLRGLQRREA